MTSPLIERVERHEYQKLFLHDLNWSRPDQPPVTIEYADKQVTEGNRPHRVSSRPLSCRTVLRPRR